MSEIIFNDPPWPPADSVWCLICLMKAKQRLIEANPDLAKIAADGKDHRHIVPWDVSIHLMPAIAKGVTDMPQLGLVDTCWTHLAFVKTTQLVPGGASLIRGQG